MNEKLRHYYQHELAAFKKQATHFSSVLPNDKDDCFVEQIIQAFAFLTARVQCKFDHELRYVTEALLTLLYPHYLLPIPAMSIMQFSLHEQAETSHTVSRHTILACDVNEQQTCYFRTVYSINLLPIIIKDLHLSNDFTIKPRFAPKNSQSCFTITLQNISDNKDLSELAFDRLRFYINSSRQMAAKFYDRIFQGNPTIVLTSSEDSDIHIKLDSSSVQTVGFSAEETLLPYPGNSFKDYQILTEYAAFPQKFFFFDVVGLKQHLQQFTSQLDLHFYFNESLNDIKHEISNDFLLLGCTPIVNLFEKEGEPFEMSNEKEKYPIIPDAHQAIETIEVYTINHLQVYAPSSELVPSQAYLSSSNPYRNKSDVLSWSVERHSANEMGEGEFVGDEVFVRFNKREAILSNHQYYTVRTKLLCTNRNLPCQISSSSQQSLFSFSESKHDDVVNMQCVTPMKAPFYRNKQDTRDMDLIKHLFVSHIPLNDPQQGLSVLKEILLLHQFSEQHDTERIINGLCDLHVETSVKRHPKGLKYGFCHGFDVMLTIDNDYFNDQSLHLLGSVLDCFFNLSSSINRFIQFNIHSKQSQKVYRWPIRLGTQMNV